ncbi:hypothetical protein ATO12_13600 [Aquimarina atlantica]|uniref:Uncharacterized protein n=1 Tax=Aquimarina atlantica TaxID=1317122 RepID=A0A023BVR9_9FLAO|nr:hypothetical protein [Aquimarina atlantica]EZH73913.1 hypothetical protein ATO12_13600 [Aquimarina atlantica]
MKVTVFKAIDDPTIDDIEKVIKDKLGDKYTYKSSRKASSMAGKLLKGSAEDSITVIKNAYHRFVVVLRAEKDPTSLSGLYTSIHFSSATLAGWLGFLHNEVGFIGRIIIRTIYGKDDPIYDEVKTIVKDSFRIEEETIDTGLGSLFKKA